MVVPYHIERTKTVNGVAWYAADFRGQTSDSLPTNALDGSTCYLSPATSSDSPKLYMCFGGTWTEQTDA